MRHWIFLIAAIASACAVRHVEPYVAKSRPAPETAIQRPLEQNDDDAGSVGSMWADNGAAGLLVKDKRAGYLGDVVQVRVEESADARRTSDVDLQRSSETGARINAFLAAANEIDINGSVGGNAKFRGAGSTARTEKVTATVPAIVKQVYRNGNLFIEGHRVVLVNNEEHHFYISGVVRRFDIDQDNTVKSSMIADAQVEFTGRGTMSQNQQQGVLQSIFGWLWPF